MSIADRGTLKRLEWDKILERLGRHCVSQPGRELVSGLLPVADIDEVRRLQEETEEAVRILRLEAGADFPAWPDIREDLQRAGRGLVLEAAAIYNVGQVLRTIRVQRRFFTERRELYPRLARHAGYMTPAPDLEREILAAVMPGGELADNASARLGNLRRRLKHTRQQVKEILDRLIRAPDKQKHLQEPIVTIREGRYVVPVKIEYRRQLPGLVHDQSASGATLFVEPMKVVERNNEIRRLQAAEKQEIYRILSDFSALIGAVSAETRGAADILAHLDFSLAKGRFSLELDAVAPAVEAGVHLHFSRVRHPLIKRDAVVPIDFHVGRDFDILVLTGPNTGGKTVALKTMGLTVLMAQAGLQVPAEEGTIGLFGRLFADIGDEQSIEDSLSTFSSHMRNIVQIVQAVQPDSLVLIDELGTGTDPTEGAALAQSILEELSGRGAKAVATTHFSELKHFATTRERVENASVEFDHVSLQPLYKLVIGRPGRSNAFEIASRLGLPGGIVRRARGYLTADQRRAEELLHNLEQTQQEAEQERAAARRQRREADRLQQKYAAEWEKLQERKQAVLEKAADRAQERLRRIRQEGEQIIRALRESIKQEAGREREQAIQEAREKISGLAGLAPPRPVPPAPKGSVPRALAPGETVFIPRFGQDGQVVAVPKPGEAVVQVGTIRVNLGFADLRRTEAAPAPVSARESAPAMMMDKTKDFKAELDMRGMRAEEALVRLDKYLDDALLSGVSRVCLIHGKGTGVLRAVVTERLRGDRRVKRFRLGEIGEGGAGVTVAEFTEDQV